MKLLAVFLFALITPAAASANGSACGYPPEITNARAERAIGQAARADLTATQVDQSFVEMARGNIASLVERFGLTRDQVVQVYVYNVCKELVARDTLPGTLSKAIARLEEGLARDVAEDSSGAPKTAKSRSEVQVSEKVDEEPGAVGGDAEPESGADASDAGALETGGDAADREAAALDQQTPTEKSGQAQESPAAKPGETETSEAAEPAKRPEPTAAPAQARQPASKSSSKSVTQGSARVNRRAYRRAPEAKQGMRIGQGYAAPKGHAGPRGNGVTSHAFRPPVSASPGSGRPAPRTAPEPQAAPAPAQPAPNAVIKTPRSAERPAPTLQPDPESSGSRAPATEESAPEIAASAPPGDGAPPAQDDAPDDSSAPEAQGMAGEATKPQPETTAEAPSDSAKAEQAASDAPASGEDAPAVSTARETSETETRARAAAAGDRSEDDCAARGVLGPECFDVDAALERLRDRPVEYNHPKEMTKGQATEITLVLRTDFTDEGLPEQVAEAFEQLQGDVRQQRAKIANIMSARLRGRDFEVDPGGMQERTVTWRRPVQWTWYVTPKEGGEDKRLQLELFAHIVNPQGEMQPPVLIKTLDATIDVDVRTFDWLIEQARTFEPIYGIAAAIIGLLTALLTLWLRRRPAHSSSEGGPPSGITASQAPPDRRISDMSAGEAAAAAARKGENDDSSPPRSDGSA